MEPTGPFRCKDLTMGDLAADRLFVVGEELFNVPESDNWTSQLAATVAFRAMRFTFPFAPVATAASAVAISAPISLSLSIAVSARVSRLVVLTELIVRALTPLMIMARDATHVLGPLLGCISTGRSAALGLVSTRLGIPIPVPIVVALLEPVSCIKSETNVFDDIQQD